MQHQHLDRTTKQSWSVPFYMIEARLYDLKDAGVAIKTWSVPYFTALNFIIMRRLLLLLLALGWGVLVFGVMYGLGYDRGAGDPAIDDTLFWAIPAALPLLIGVFVTNTGTGWHRYIRWASVALLVAQALFVLVFTWIKPLVLAPLLGVCLLLWPKVNSPQLHWRQWLLNATLPLVCLGSLVWWQYFHFPLPSDAAMTAHFNDHRAEFEQLVKGYRDFRRYLPTAEDYREEKQINDLEDKLKRENKLTPEARRAIDEARRQGLKKYGPSYEMLPDVKALMAKLEVYGIGGAGQGGEWYPDHYSAKTIQTVKRYMGYWIPIKEQLTEPESIQLLKKELPSLFEGTTFVRDVMDVAQLTKVVELQRGKPKQPEMLIRWRYSTFLRKSYYHFPQPPRVENGHVLIHSFHASGAVDLAPGLRVFDSLDSYPPDWQAGECVLKRIDEQWFIALCRSY